VSRLSAEELLLAFYGNLVTGGWKDRRNPGGEPEGLHHETGVPLQESDLAPRSMAIGGRQLALEHHVVPRSFAAGCSWREHTNADGKRELVSLCAFPESTWTQLEHEHVQYLTREVKLAAHRLRERAGWFITQPHEHTGSPMALGADGLALGIMITPKGLEAAIQFVKRRPDLQRLAMPAQAFGSDQWSKAPAWARSYYADRSQTSLPTAL